MSEVVSSQLKSKFDLHSEELDHKEPVIVTFEASVERDDLVAVGLDVKFISQDGRIASGSLDRRALARLAEHPRVSKIEPDTEMHALGD